MSTDRVVGVGNLREPFLAKLLALESRLRAEGVPMVRWETYRGRARQELLLRRGVSRAGWGKSPHNYGLAADYVLDVNKVAVRRRSWKGQLFPDAWDTETPEALAVWLSFGTIAESLDLEWGGRWEKLPDFPHVELRGWRFLVPKQ